MSEDLYHVKIPVKDITKEAATARTTMRAPMILPHELLNYLSETWLAHSQFKAIGSSPELYNQF